MVRTCYACSSDKTVQYRQRYSNGKYHLWYTNQPTDLVLCNRCYNHYIKKPRHLSLTPPGHPNYWSVHQWARRNRPKPAVCETCGIDPPLEVANIDEAYEKDISHFRWMCVSCHAIRDGRGHHHSPRSWSEEAVQRQVRLTITRVIPSSIVTMRTRSFSLPDEIDIALRKRAADDNMRFSDVVIVALCQYLNSGPGEKEKEKVSKKSHG